MIHNKRLNARTYLVIFFFTVLMFFCAAIAFSQDPCDSGWVTCEWTAITITIDTKKYDCYVNGQNGYFYFLGNDGMVMVSDDSCYAAVNEWSHTFISAIPIYRLSRI